MNTFIKRGIYLYPTSRFFGCGPLTSHQAENQKPRGVLLVIYFILLRKQSAVICLSCHTLHTPLHSHLPSSSFLLPSTHLIIRIRYAARPRMIDAPARDALRSHLAALSTEPRKAHLLVGPCLSSLLSSHRPAGILSDIWCSVVL